MARTSVAVFYYAVTDGNAIGRCTRTMVGSLCESYDFTVFASSFDNPRPDRIRWVRVHSPGRPLFVQYTGFRVAALLAWIAESRRRGRFDLTISSDGCVDFAELQHVHFCNRHYGRYFLRLRDFLSVRGFASAIDHIVRAMWEGLVYRRSRSIVVPSEGLRKELIDQYHIEPEKISVIANPIDLRLYAPANGKKPEIRSRLNLGPDELVCTFVALGHFERKGLGELIEAMADAAMSSVTLLVVGGNSGAVAPYLELTKKLGVGGRVKFCGRHTDTRPFLQAADALVLPSRYETFSLVAIEAAACGVPVLSTKVSGIEDWAVPGETGYYIRSSRAGDIVSATRLFMDLSAEQRALMGENARRAALDYDVAKYTNAFDKAVISCFAHRARHELDKNGPPTAREEHEN